VESAGARAGPAEALLYALAQHHPASFTDVTLGTNALFGGSCCPARAGYDTATGWGSPAADVVASALVR
jgi:hypothetical protein